MFFFVFFFCFVLFFFILFFFFFTRSGVIRIVVRRSARQPAEQHRGRNNTQQGYARFAFDECQCGGRVLKRQQPFGCLFGYLPLGMSSPDPLGYIYLGVATSL